MNVYLIYLALSELPIWLKWLRNFGWWLVFHTRYASAKEKWRWRPRPDLDLNLRSVIFHRMSTGYVRKRHLLEAIVFDVFDRLTGMLLGVKG